MAWDSYLEKNQDRFVEELRSFISIPSVSAADEHFGDVVKAGEWVASKLQSIGISNARLMKTQTHPVVYGDWLHAGENKPTILIYGHFDVQPADPYDLWDSPPFQTGRGDPCAGDTGSCGHSSAHSWNGWRLHRCAEKSRCCVQGHRDGL